MENRCVMCNEIIPEGVMVCPSCERKVEQDTRRTKALLREYRDLEWKAMNAREIIRECEDMMTSMQGFSSATPVMGGGSKREEMIVNCIDRKSRAEYAVVYMQMMNRAMSLLTEDERELILSFYADRVGIRWVCRRYKVGRSRAYEICDNALRRLDRLLF